MKGKHRRLVTSRAVTYLSPFRLAFTTPLCIPSRTVTASTPPLCTALVEATRRTLGSASPPPPLPIQSYVRVVRYYTQVSMDR